MSGVYIDTSALAKRYLVEARSEELLEFLESIETVFTSRLTLLELQCTLHRRVRTKSLPMSMSREIQKFVDTDIQNGNLQIVPLADRDVVSAMDILERSQRFGLRAADAIHLATAHQMKSPLFATADQLQGKAAEALKMKLVFFG
jgi:predicted nucleic acid-binding protein